MAVEIVTVAKGSAARESFWIEEFSGDEQNVATAGNLYVVTEGVVPDMALVVRTIRETYYGDPAASAVDESLSGLERAVAAAHQALTTRPSIGVSAVAAVVTGRGELFLAYAGHCQCFVFRFADGSLERVTRREFGRSLLGTGRGPAVGTEFRALTAGDMVFLLSGTVLDSVTEGELEGIAHEASSLGLDAAAEMILERVHRRDPSGRATVVVVGANRVEVEEPTPLPATGPPAGPELEAGAIANPQPPESAASGRRGVPAMMAARDRSRQATRAAADESGTPPGAASVAFEDHTMADDLEAEDSAPGLGLATPSAGATPAAESMASRPRDEAEDDAPVPLWIAPATALEPVQSRETWDPWGPPIGGLPPDPELDAPQPEAHRTTLPPPVPPSGQPGSGWRIPLMPTLPLPKDLEDTRPWEAEPPPRDAAPPPAPPRDWSRYPREPGPMRRGLRSVVRFLMLVGLGLLVAAVLVTAVTVALTLFPATFVQGSTRTQATDGDLFTRPFARQAVVRAADAGSALAVWSEIDRLSPLGDAGDEMALQQIVFMLEDLMRATPGDPRVGEKLAVARVNLQYRQRLAEVNTWWTTGTTADTAPNWARVVEALESLWGLDLPGDYRRIVAEKLYAGHVNYARALEAGRRMSEAIGHYQRARQIDPTRPEAVEALSRVLR